MSDATRLFAQLAVAMGFVEEAAVQACLAEAGGDLAQVLVARGLLSDQQRRAVTLVQTLRTVQQENLLFARIATANGLLSEVRAAAAQAEVQRRRQADRTRPVRLAEVLAEQGLLTAEQIAGVEQVQRRLYQQSGREKVLFGDIAVEHELATESAVFRGLQAQEAEPDKPLGRIMVEQQIMREEDVQQVLAVQRERLDAPAPLLPAVPRHEMLFGKLLIKKGWLDADQVKTALRIQALRHARGQDAPLGEILIEKNLLTPAQVAQVLDEQKKKILECPSCGTLHNVEAYDPAATLKCKRCHALLRTPSTADAVHVDETISAPESLTAGAPNADDTAFLTEMLGAGIQQKIGASGAADDEDEDEDEPLLASSSGIFAAPPPPKDTADDAAPPKKGKRTWWRRGK